MTAGQTHRKYRGGYLSYLMIAGAVCAIVSGCAAPPAATSTPASKPQPTQADAAKPTTAEKPTPVKAPAQKPQVAQPPSAKEPSATATPAERTAPSDVDREKLAALIRERAAARAKEVKREPKKPASEPAVVPGHLSRQMPTGPKPAGSAERATARDLENVRTAPEKPVEMQPTPGAAQPDTGAKQEVPSPAASPTVTSQPAPDAAARGAEAAGCKGPQPDAPVPPPPDQPQPKLVIKNPRVVREHVWAGQKADFEFEIANEGEGPLQILLKRG